MGHRAQAPHPDAQIPMEKPRISVRADMRETPNALETGAPAPEVPLVPPAAAVEAAPAAPQSVGAAATPPAVVGMTPAEVQKYRSTAEGSKLLEPQQPGIPDRNQYVPGVTPTAAEQVMSLPPERRVRLPAPFTVLEKVMGWLLFEESIEGLADKTTGPVNEMAPWLVVTEPEKAVDPAPV